MYEMNLHKKNICTAGSKSQEIVFAAVIKALFKKIYILKIYIF